ncbi:hypothetical protein WJX75_001757 [Coccomyxa subellipsoidea]|uniref:NADP-dependent oxidoreductase domain-containing protein n=1 Tax=Coccomyxa subellipsoidea TaxID=248742 RepID=A0ABR2YGB7_9CHLO
MSFGRILQRNRSLHVAITIAVGTTSGDTRELGKSGLEVTSIGVGAWSWGDRTGYWGYNGYGNYGADENQLAFDALIDSGIGFIDTAEVYGFGKSEELTGEFMRRKGASPVIATKFAPLPWRFTSGSVVSACEASLKRLQVPSVGLYMIHWPGFAIQSLANDAFVEGLAEVKQAGLAQAVGVSNFREDRLRRAHKILQDKGVVLASNQVQYSLLYRAPEKNGVLRACNELGITLIAYSPLAQGLLTGKYGPGNKPGGPRSGIFTEERLKGVQPLIGLMRDIGSGHGGKTPAQVAINWTICKGVLPIPGAKNARQAAEVAGAMGWRLTTDEMAALDSTSSRSGADFFGAPFETW